MAPPFNLAIFDVNVLFCILAYNPPWMQTPPPSYYAELLLKTLPYIVIFEEEGIL